MAALGHHTSVLNESLIFVLFFPTFLSQPVFEKYLVPKNRG